MDPDRARACCRFAWRDDMSFERYVEWALDVPMFMVKREGESRPQHGPDLSLVHERGLRRHRRPPTTTGSCTWEPWSRRSGSRRPSSCAGPTACPRTCCRPCPRSGKGPLYDAQTRSKVEQLVSSITFESAEASRLGYGQQGLQGHVGRAPACGVGWAHVHRPGPRRPRPAGRRPPTADPEEPSHLGAPRSHGHARRDACGRADRGTRHQPRSRAPGDGIGETLTSSLA